VTSLVDSQAKEVSVESALFSIIAAADADDKIVSFPNFVYGGSKCS
jgi:hypothetical protein